MNMAVRDFDPETYVGPLPSPCINVCQMNASSGLCQGCWRTIAEIVAWGTAGEAEKRTIWLAIKHRIIE
jgi:predicted Fe-S protein YdhL (DUF1289 family)